jgi:hypothetical protein
LVNSIFQFQRFQSQSNLPKGKRQLQRRLSRWMLSGLVAIALVGAGDAMAAERVMLTYGPFRRSVSVEELTTLAETGEASRAIQFYLRAANKSPQDLQELLNREVDMDVVLVDRVLNSFVGRLALDQISTVIYTPSRQTDRQALRSALVLSAADDDAVTLLEIMQNYPTSEVYVDGERLVDAYRQLAALREQFDFLLNLRWF